MKLRPTDISLSSLYCICSILYWGYNHVTIKLTHSRNLRKQQKYIIFKHHIQNFAFFEKYKVKTIKHSFYSLGFEQGSLSLVLAVLEVIMYYVPSTGLELVETLPTQPQFTYMHMHNYHLTKQHPSLSNHIPLLLVKQNMSICLKWENILSLFLLVETDRINCFIV